MTTSNRQSEDRHTAKLRGIRGIDDQAWATFGRVADALGSDRSALIRQYVAFMVGRVSELPERPVVQTGPEGVLRAVEQLRQRHQ